MSIFTICNFTVSVKMLPCIYVDRLDGRKGSRILCMGISGGKRASWHQSSS